MAAAVLFSSAPTWGSRPSLSGDGLSSTPMSALAPGSPDPFRGSGPRRLSDVFMRLFNPTQHSSSSSSSSSHSSPAGQIRPDPKRRASGPTILQPPSPSLNPPSASRPQTPTPALVLAGAALAGKNSPTPADEVCPPSASASLEVSVHSVESSAQNSEENATLPATSADAATADQDQQDFVTDDADGTAYPSEGGEVFVPTLRRPRLEGAKYNISKRYSFSSLYSTVTIDRMAKSFARSNTEDSLFTDRSETPSAEPPIKLNDEKEEFGRSIDVMMQDPVIAAALKNMRGVPSLEQEPIIAPMVIPSVTSNTGPSSPITPTKTEDPTTPTAPAPTHARRPSRGHDLLLNTYAAIVSEIADLIDTNDSTADKTADNSDLASTQPSEASKTEDGDPDSVYVIEEYLVEHWVPVAAMPGDAPEPLHLTYSAADGGITSKAATESGSASLIEGFERITDEGLRGDALREEPDVASVITDEPEPLLPTPPPESARASSLAEKRSDSDSVVPSQVSSDAASNFNEAIEDLTITAPSNSLRKSGSLEMDSSQPSAVKVAKAAKKLPPFAQSLPTHVSNSSPPRRPLSLVATTASTRSNSTGSNSTTGGSGTLERRRVVSGVRRVTTLDRRSGKKAVVHVEVVLVPDADVGDGNDAEFPRVDGEDSSESVLDASAERKVCPVEDREGDGNGNEPAEAAEAAAGGVAAIDTVSLNGEPDAAQIALPDDAAEVPPQSPPWEGGVLAIPISSSLKQMSTTKLVIADGSAPSPRLVASPKSFGDELPVPQAAETVRRKSGTLTKFFKFMK
ncbi:hypothetical protein DFJ73DRAFT_874130 [Zopfochytrium polystomum]|nr:hypothetical protein DFJ73DRAFT_874130 [Zopfochytrium polystomum]